MNNNFTKKKINITEVARFKNYLKLKNIHTICEEARCPNISECFCNKQATFLILGNICTRSCKFCSVSKGKPYPVDIEEPIRIANEVKKLNLTYVVLTSPTRDDLEDGGADIFYKTTKEILKLSPNCKVELLIPDFNLNIKAIEKVANSGAVVIGHNLETVKRLYHIRYGADYNLSLSVLKLLKVFNNQIKTKSGIMVGLGETKEEVFELMNDLINVQCDYLTIGQYLSPTKNHYPVVEYVKDEVYYLYKEKAMNLGFTNIEAAPYVRSSYNALNSSKLL